MSTLPKSTIRLTMAQALVRYLAALRTPDQQPLFGGAFAIFGHGNVAGLGEALYQYREQFPTYRAHNEQAMAHAAIAYAKAHMRRRMMAVTSSIGPGATNLLTAAALAHVNRLPVLLLPGDVFVSRAPDPVLQQLEDGGDGSVSVNDAFKPLSRYFDRIIYPEQLLTALPRAIAALTDPAACGPVTLSLPQDVQTMAYDYPEEFFEPRIVRFRALPAVESELEEAAALLKKARQPLIVAGGGVLYGEASAALRAFAERHGVPVAETQAGKGALPWDHPLQLGAIGVTGSPAANALAADADLVLAVGTRLQDFTTGSNSLFGDAQLVSLNVNAFDALKRRGLAVQADASLALQGLSRQLEGWHSAGQWRERAQQAGTAWRETVAAITGKREVAGLPYDGEVIGAVQRSSPDSTACDIVVCAAGTLPAELHKLWRTSTPGGYHMEYGYSCMGYEIAGGLGVKMAKPDAEVIVMVGDGSYLMMNSEIATSVMLDKKLIIVVLDNRGYGCINRLQQACGNAPFNNMLADCLQAGDGAPQIDFALHARSLGALSEHVADIAGLEQAMLRARAATRTYLICINTDDTRTTEEGGCWWEVAVPAVSTQEGVRAARARYETERLKQRN
ncbi:MULTISPECIES: 3D-(3,5/4)-trihydroxycyclohexane-1,2-dione acylhydrolase (decyclizing) [unclassified Janthinobacterium]|uniref:3D-(3,5/4)-trihydroxycyclohexane-1,2-dione acylhydrolase (decyclizing) n=1 Tax=unclassified Janthinobacterium TaxID=2610881 RepID=UPI001619E1D1|nr:MULTISPECIES: 3D-(3,5/4)-trihydroxycyclohexane-1,2-dione acylhydrolase (decyclizing) [unclassified Janthinobacterium]MBB5366684.1 3D-(3,5/4)-trihydroxycyclohexane-1,2-dione acylhydrolase (decyclizing) [Janthinobacterium sp. K2C7]MBB5380838.1 3D-(3,5/4)-trihydroxycyclohexane-1,2-dione acylhydrolase (decyclizing) [Janthinobacterium sp. K2Li3]MBB5385066.1 3D-(3,5/4)-trihydroxycyclohexane-1,2-dione acylhydrolase (decyclizing) [Janthinobacterium sp. K2E3]